MNRYVSNLRLFNLIISFFVTQIIVHTVFSNPLIATDKTVPIEFVSVPSGSYRMGADLNPKYIVAGENEGWRSIFIQDEFPQRIVHITRAFEISKYEIDDHGKLIKFEEEFIRRGIYPQEFLLVLYVDYHL